MNSFEETNYAPHKDSGVMVPLKTNKDTIIYNAVTFYNYKNRNI